MVPGVGWLLCLHWVFAVVEVSIVGVPVITQWPVCALPGSRRKTYGVMLLTRDLLKVTRDLMYLCETCIGVVRGLRMCWLRLRLEGVVTGGVGCGFICAVLNGTRDWRRQSLWHIRILSPSSGGCSLRWGPSSAVVSADTKNPEVALGVGGVWNAALDRGSKSGALSAKIGGFMCTGRVMPSLVDTSWSLFLVLPPKKTTDSDERRKVIPKIVLMAVLSASPIRMVIGWPSILYGVL